MAKKSILTEQAIQQLEALAGFHTACTTILNPKVDQEIRDTFLQISCHCFEAGLNVKNNSEDE